MTVHKVPKVKRGRPKVSSSFERNLYEVVWRFLDGEEIKEFAKEYNVTPRTIYNWMATPEWKQAVEKIRAKEHQVQLELLTEQKEAYRDTINELKDLNRQIIKSYQAISATLNANAVTLIKQIEKDCGNDIYLIAAAYKKHDLQYLLKSSVIASDQARAMAEHQFSVTAIANYLKKIEKNEQINGTKS